MKTFARVLVLFALAGGTVAPPRLVAQTPASAATAPAGMSPVIAVGEPAPESAAPGAAASSAPAATSAASDTASTAAPSSPSASSSAPALPAPPRPLPPRRAVDALTDPRQALELLRAHCIAKAALDDDARDRALLQGLLERLGGGASLREAPSASPTTPASSTTPASPATPPAERSPFRSEILDGRVGYVRLGSLTAGCVRELDAALANFRTARVDALVLDLRATPPGGDFELAAEVAKRLAPVGTLLFSIHRPGLKQERIYTADREPAFAGVAVALVRRGTAGAAEVIAASLRGTGRALVVGQTTAGEAAEFAEFPLPVREAPTDAAGEGAGGNAESGSPASRAPAGLVLRVAVAEVKLPGGVSAFPDGLRPDLPVAIPAREEEEALRAGLERGVSGLVFESERARLNEAALVRGLNPELEEETEPAAREREERAARVVDTALQRAVDLVTAVGLIGGREPGRR